MDLYKDNLLASVIHDLKTPINCMISFIKNAFVSKNLNEIKQLLNIILKNA